MVRRRRAGVLLCVLALSCVVSADVLYKQSQRQLQDEPPATPPTPSPPSPFPGIPDDPEQVDRNCRLLGPFALFVQAVMGVVVVGSLVLKRQREKPKRPWKIWMLDISKQMLGQLFVHTLNVVLSSLGSIASEGESNPCSLYFLNIAVDTTIGVLFIYYSIRFLTHYFTDVLGWPGFVSGQYTSTPPVLGRRRRAGPRRMNSTMSSEGGQSTDGGLMQSTESTRSKTTTKPRLSFFFRQLALYLLSLLLMKIMVLILFGIFPFLFDVGRWVLDLFGEHKKGQIFFVMALFPLLMNTIQFWLIDSVLRHDPNTSRYRSEEDERRDAAGLQNGGSASRESDVEHFGGRDSSIDDEDEAAATALPSQHEQGPWTSAWWMELLGAGGSGDGRGGGKKSRARGQYQELPGRHSIGEASTDDEHDDREQEEDQDSAHTYPPNSQSSSIAQLDVAGAEAGRQDGGAETKSPLPSDKRAPSAKHAAYGAMLGSPPLHAQQRGNGDVPGPIVDEDDYDAWSDDAVPIATPSQVDGEATEYDAAKSPSPPPMRRKNS